MDYQLVVDWINSGTPEPKESDAKLTKLEVFPRSAKLLVGDQQPLVIRARYSDGREEDVTRWVRFSSTNQTVANVDDNGNVSIIGHGEGAIVGLVFQSDCAVSRHCPLSAPDRKRRVSAAAKPQLCRRLGT